jgi:hypothetical protein
MNLYLTKENLINKGNKQMLQAYFEEQKNNNLQQMLSDDYVKMMNSSSYSKKANFL